MLVKYVIGNLASSCMVFSSGRDVLNHIYAWTHVTWNEAGKRCAITVCHHKVFHVAMYLCTMIKQKTKRDEMDTSMSYVVQIEDLDLAIALTHVLFLQQK